MKYAELRKQLDRHTEELYALRGGRNDRIRYLLCEGPNALYANVSIDGRDGNYESPSITVIFSGTVVGNWDALTADQLERVMELRREIERWQNDQRDDLPDPKIWNGGYR